MKYKLHFFFFAIAVFVGFIFFSRSVKHGFMRGVDFIVTVKVQDKISSRLDGIMDDGGILADPFVSSGMVIVLTGLVFLKTKGKKKVMALVIPAAFVLLTLIEIYGKNFVPHPGPPFFMVKHPTTIFPKYHIVQPYSYPSGHMARITFLGVIVSGVLYSFGNTQGGYVSGNPRKKKGIIIAVMICSYIFFMAVSRIYLGHHWLSDIIGGALLGGAMSLLSVGFLL